MSSDNPPDDQQGTAGSDRPAQDDKRNAIALEIEALKEQQEAHHREDGSAENRHHGWNVATTFGVWLYTILTFVIVVISICQIKQSERNAKQQHADASEALVSASSAASIQQRQTDQALERAAIANRIAQDAEQRQLRAYMVMTSLALFCEDCGDTTFHPAILDPPKNSILDRIENTGQTPASNVDVVLTWWPVNGRNAKLPKNYMFPDPQKKSLVISRSDVGKDKTKDGSSSIYDRDIPLFKSAVNGNITLFIYGHIDYCDIFKMPRSTAFCFVYAPHKGENLPICDRFNGEISPRGSCPANP